MEKGADPAVKDKNGSTPLDYANALGRQGVVQVLKAHAAK